VTIGYTNAQGNHSVRVIDSAELDGHHLVAWCHLRDDERVFSLHRIDSVAPAT
jgi:predicted DNA-binding transcriptional regulator YafY